MTNALEAICKEVDSMHAEEIRSPSAPPEVLLAEARALIEMLRQDDALLEPLRSLGIDEEWLQKTDNVATAAEIAQTQWDAVAHRGETGRFTELETSAIKLRAELIAACRYHLRYEAHMLEEIDAVQEGEGPSDLILDLDTLARFIRARRRSFRGDDSFDADARAQLARDLAHDLRRVLHDLPADRERDAARKLRNRAFAKLARLVFEIRTAGMYRYWDDEQVAQAFISRYEQQHLLCRYKSSGPTF